MERHSKMLYKMKDLKAEGSGIKYVTLGKSGLVVAVIFLQGMKEFCQADELTSADQVVPH